MYMQLVNDNLVARRRSSHAYGVFKTIIDHVFVLVRAREKYLCFCEYV